MKLLMPGKPPTPIEKLEKLIYLILLKEEPRLRDRIKVSYVGRGRRIYEVSMNGKGAQITLGILPLDKRFKRIVKKAAPELLHLLHSTPFPMPLSMTALERLGWNELKRLGAPEKNRTLDLRGIHFEGSMDRFYRMPRLIQAIRIVVDRHRGANSFIEDSTGPIKVTTREGI